MKRIVTFYKFETIAGLLDYTDLLIWSLPRKEFHTSKNSSYLRPYSEYLTTFFKIKAAVSRMCFVIGSSFSSWNEKLRRVIVCNREHMLPLMAEIMLILHKN